MTKPAEPRGLTLKELRAQLETKGTAAQAVARDVEEREQVGIVRYGSPLTSESINDALRDAYEEALDLAIYLKQELLRREAACRD